MRRLAAVLAISVLALAACTAAGAATSTVALHAGDNVTVGCDGSKGLSQTGPSGKWVISCKGKAPSSPASSSPGPASSGPTGVPTSGSPSPTDTDPPTVSTPSSDPSTVPVGFPDASTTGPTVSTFTPSGCITANISGEVIQGVSLNGCDINVTAKNVVIRNVKMVMDDPTGWAIIIRDGASATIDHVDIGGAGQGAKAVEYTILSQSDLASTVSNSNLHDCADCIQGEDLTVAGNYIHDLANPPGAHVDGFQCNSSCGVTITGNTILNSWSQTSAIALFGDFGTPKDSTIAGNLLAGGGYTIYSGTPPSTGITITGNTISKRYFPLGGQFGWLDQGGGNTLTGNVYDDGTPAK